MSGRAHRQERIVRAITFILAVTVAVTAALWLLTRHHQHPDCLKVRAMIDYNKSQRQALANAFNPERGAQPSLDDYQRWADNMQAYATSITDPQLAPHAHRLADETQQFVSLNAQIRNDTSVPADADAPPSWAQTYANLNQQFNDELGILDKACPAPNAR
ncbi:MAG: hypothetical protein ACLPLP_13400 [Mycobacterium sp.]